MLSGTKVGSSQYKSHFLPFFPSCVLLGHNKKPDLCLPDSRDLVNGGSVKKVPYLAAGNKLLKYPSLPLQVADLAQESPTREQWSRFSSC